MTLKFSPTTFSVAYCVGYVLAFRWNHPLVIYYPIPHRWVWPGTDAAAGPGPPILWYGLVASATLVALATTAVAALTASWWGERGALTRAAHWLWLVPWLAVAYCAYLLRQFFL